VVIAGDTAAVPEANGLHAMNHAAFAAACEAMFEPVRSPGTLAEDVCRAFTRAQLAPGPVVLNVPVDIQEALVAPVSDYRPSWSALPPSRPLLPSAAEVGHAVELLLAAEHPVLLAGRGAVERGAVATIERLAEAIGAAVATTYPAKGSFAGNPYDIGVVGPYGSLAGAELVAESDCIVAFGASLSFHTTRDDHAFPRARIILVNTDRGARIAGRRAADLHLVADVAETAEALLAEVGQRARPERVGRVRWPSEPELIDAEIIAQPVDLAPDVLDPRQLIAEIDAALPSRCVVVTAAARSSYFPSRFVRGARDRRFVNTSEFGSVGHAIGTAIGVSCAETGQVVVVFDGDGSAIMNVQELQTAAETRARLLIVIVNNEAYGSELQRMTHDPEGAALSEMPSPSFVAVAEALGMPGRLATRTGQARSAVAEFLAGTGPLLIDARISRAVDRPAPRSAGGAR
jgi:thiamine pyrophosphate-dependent acetolactate synthase large subunit-like protein